MTGLVIRTTGIEDYLDDTGQAFIKALLMGQANAGKTRSASFWPKPIFADCEKGRMSIADRKMPYVEVNTSDEMFAVLDMLDQECKKPYDQRKYQTFVVDTLDSYQRKVIAERLRAEHKEALSGWADWGYLDAKMTMLVERLLNLPMNIVVNLHLKEKGGSDDDGPTVKEPKLKGDIRDQIANEFDLVGYMSTFWEAVGGERTLVRGIKWEPTPDFPILKDRSGQLGKFTPVNFTEEDYDGLLERFKRGVEGLTASEEVGTIEVPEGAKPVPANLVGGPVPAPKTEALPKTAAKKAAAPPKKAAATAPAATPAVPAAAPAAAPAVKTAAAPVTSVPPARSVPPAAKPVEVVETGGADPAPTPEATSEPTTDVVASDVDEAPADAVEPTHDEAVAVATEALGATPVEDEPDEVAAPEAAAEPEAPAEPQAAAPAEDPIPCGTPGRLKDGTPNENPVPGCGRNLREITDETDRDRINIAYLATRTYLCPSCHAAHKKTA